MPESSKRERAEEAFREGEGRLRATYEQATIGIALVGLDGRWLWFNQQLCDIVGYSHEEMMGLTFQDITHPDDLDADLGQARRLRAGEITTYSTQKRYVRKDKSVVCIKLTASLVSTPPGQHDYLISVVEEITQRDLAVELFRTLADSIPQLCWVAVPEGYIVWYNRRWVDYTGRTLEQMWGRKWVPVLDADVRPKVMERWDESVTSGQPFDMVIPIHGKDGVARPFLTRVQPVKDHEGRVVWWFGTHTDVSEMKRVEEALKEADRNKDEFLAILAHELRNPLATLRNALQILRISTDRETHEQARSTMQRQLDQMVRLVDDLLDVSRISTGKLELRKEPVQLRAVVGRAVETSRPLIDSMGHNLQITLPDQPLTVDADQARLAQVVSNLLNNSAKYTERGGHISLIVERRGSDVLVSVKDNGIGIAADQLPGIFGMYSQAQRALERAQGGLGIGLTLVKRLVEMHGGRIEARSEGPGKGSEYIVRLPLIVEASGPSAHAGRDEPPAPKSSHRAPIVDDNRDGAEKPGAAAADHGR
jgi:PAS domain S-box-containing protein